MLKVGRPYNLWSLSTMSSSRILRESRKKQFMFMGTKWTLFTWVRWLRKCHIVLRIISLLPRVATFNVILNNFACLFWNANDMWTTQRRLFSSRQKPLGIGMITNLNISYLVDLCAHPKSRAKYELEPPHDHLAHRSLNDPLCVRWRRTNQQESGEKFKWFKC